MNDFGESVREFYRKQGEERALAAASRNKTSLSDLHAEGVRDLGSFELGKLVERDRIIKLLEERVDKECGFGITHDLIALIKGEK
jgi:hypothetical protein